jgi:hypothetical protein
MAIIDYVLGIIHRDEEGQGLAEYALILALIAIVAIVALIFLGGPPRFRVQGGAVPHHTKVRAT